MATLVKTWTFRSNSNPNKTYETSQYEDGSTSCQCRGWTFAKNGVRSCTHTRKVEQGIADREALSVWNADAPVRAPQRNLPAETKVDPRLAKVKKQVEKETDSFESFTPMRKINWKRS